MRWSPQAAQPRNPTHSFFKVKVARSLPAMRPLIETSLPIWTPHTSRAHAQIQNAALGCGIRPGRYVRVRVLQPRHAAPETIRLRRKVPLHYV